MQHEASTSHFSPASLACLLLDHTCLPTTSLLISTAIFIHGASSMKASLLMPDPSCCQGPAFDYIPLMTSDHGKSVWCPCSPIYQVGANDTQRESPQSQLSVSLRSSWLTVPAAYALGFLDCDHISARCMLSIFQFFATKTDASVLRMLNGAPGPRLLQPIADYVRSRGGRIHTRTGCR